MGRTVCFAVTAALVGATLFAMTCESAHAEAQPLPNEIAQADAITLALQYVGLTSDKEVAAAAERDLVPQDDNVPFLELAGKPIWRVTLDNVNVEVHGPSGKVYRNPTIHQFAVVLDRSDGRLLRITTPLPSDENASTVPTRAQREQAMRAGGDEVYEGFPAEMPRVNLVQALQAAYDGLGGVTKAKQIEALYVLLRRTASPQIAPVLSCRDTPCPRWEITLRYLPPIRMPPPSGLDGRPAHYELPPFLNILHEIDPSSGKWLGARTVP